MVAAIGSSNSETIYQTSSGNSLAGLEAQLARYQKELSDCVNCDSANTAQGKETIQAISNKISSIKVRIEAQQNAQQPSHDTLNASTTNRPQTEKVANSIVDPISYPDDKRIGRVIDVKA